MNLNGLFLNDDEVNNQFKKDFINIPTQHLNSEIKKGLNPFVTINNIKA